MEVDTKSIDINIHPTKTEIKFDDEHTIYAILRATVKHSLGQFSIAPVLDFNKDTGFETPYSYTKKSPVHPSIDTRINTSTDTFVDTSANISVNASTDTFINTNTPINMSNQHIQSIHSIDTSNR